MRAAVDTCGVARPLVHPPLSATQPGGVSPATWADESSCIEAMEGKDEHEAETSTPRAARATRLPSPSSGPGLAILDSLSDDRPHIPLATLQNRFVERRTRPHQLGKQPLRRPGSRLVRRRSQAGSPDTISRDTAEQYIRQQADDANALHANLKVKGALLEAQLHRQSSRFEALLSPGIPRTLRAVPLRFTARGAAGRQPGDS